MNLKPKAKCTRHRIIISGIGTGGHYFPAIVVGREFVKRAFEVIFLIRKNYPEEYIALMHNLKIFEIKSKPFYGKKVTGKILSLLLFVYSTHRLNSLVKNSIGLAFGGFGSLPLVVACLINRRPYYLFEPNRIPGRATRLFSLYAKRVFLGMPLATEIKGKIVITGIPIREEFKISSNRITDIKAHRKTVLFYGGSQGAKRLNSLALELMKKLPQDYEIVVISGNRDYNWVNANKDSRTKVIPFSNSPWEEIKNIDVIVSRAGALAGYEILAMNKRVIFIPFPFAIDNHQYYNGKYFSQIGNGIMVEEKDIDAQKLTRLIVETMERKEYKKAEIILDAERKIADIVEQDIR